MTNSSFSFSLGIIPWIINLVLFIGLVILFQSIFSKTIGFIVSYSLFISIFEIFFISKGFFSIGFISSFFSSFFVITVLFIFSTNPFLFIGTYSSFSFSFPINSMLSIFPIWIFWIIFFLLIISNSSISWFSNFISLGIDKRLIPEPWICKLFQEGLTSNISYSLGISNSSTHWGELGSFSDFNISKPSNSWIIILYSFFIWGFFILIISKPSNSCIEFLCLFIIEVMFISSIFWKINWSSSSFFLERIIKDCKCWQIFFGFFIFDIILKEFISWISKTASESEIVSCMDSSFIFWEYFSIL